MSENLKIWDAVFHTDPSQTKEFKRTGGFSGTAIKPLYLIHKATELWGSMGDAWGAEEVCHVINGDMVFMKARLWYPGKTGKAVVEHWGGDVLKKSDKPNDEAFKMAFTDAIGKCLVQLGFSADVHMGLFDGNKYVAPTKDATPYGTAKARSDKYTEIMAEIEGAESLADLGKVWTRNKNHIKAISAEPELGTRLVSAKDARKRLLEDRNVNTASFGNGFVETPTDEPVYGY